VNRQFRSACGASSEPVSVVVVVADESVVDVVVDMVDESDGVL
jgi:hypothetical protein